MCPFSTGEPNIGSSSSHTNTSGSLLAEYSIVGIDVSCRTECIIGLNGSEILRGVTRDVRDVRGGAGSLLSALSESMVVEGSRDYWEALYLVCPVC